MGSQLSGMGRLRSNQSELGEVEYRLDIDRSGHMADGRGTLAGAYGALFKAFSTGKASLILEDGRDVAIIITHLDAAGAEFKVSGPVPDL
jgi:hypothetical protein